MDTKRGSNPYRAEIGLVMATMLVATLGFWTIYVGPDADPQPRHHLHFVTTFSWMALLMTQLILLVRGRPSDHRRIGLTVLAAAAPLLASVALLTVGSAYRGWSSGEGDFLIVQNILGTIWLGAFLVLAFVLRRRRKLHGAFLMATLLLFMGPALFFALLAFAPPFRIEGPDTFYRFGTAAMTGQAIITVTAVLFFLRDRRNNWPYLLAAASFVVGEVLKILLQREGLIDPLTRFTGSLSQAWAFGLCFVGLLAVLAAILVPQRLRGRSVTERAIA
jgi:hypothetical protein